MVGKSTNIVFALQNRIAVYLNSELGEYGIEFFAENNRDIEYQIKNALARQGIACIVTTPELNYQGHNNQFYSYDATVELQIAENPTVNRARMKKDGLGWGTGLDVATTATDLLGGPNTELFLKMIPTTIKQTNEGALVVTRARLNTHLKRTIGKSAWKVESWPTLPQSVGMTINFRESEERPPIVETIWGNDGEVTVVEQYWSDGNYCSYIVEDAREGSEEQWSTGEIDGKRDILDFSDIGGPILRREST